MNQRRQKTNSCIIYESASRKSIRVGIYIYFVEEKSFSNPCSKYPARLNLIGVYTNDFSTPPGNVPIPIHV